MDKFEITVIVATYNQSVESICSTLDSILMQENITFFIIITDDGSVDNHKGDIFEYFNKRSFENFLFIDNKVNKGTVSNLICALNKTKTEYVKDISPGDYLYNKNTLADFYKIAVNNNADFVCGNAVYYQKIDNKNQIISSSSMPYDKNAYLKNKHMVKTMLINRDRPQGAAELQKTLSYKDVLLQIENKVKYCEDLSIQLALLEKYSILYIDKEMVLYEEGTGISNSSNSKHYQMIINDEITMNSILAKKMSRLNIEKHYINELERLNQFLLEKNKLKKFMIGLFIPDKMLDSIKRRLVKTNGSTKAPSKEENPMFY